MQHCPRTTFSVSAHSGSALHTATKRLAIVCIAYGNSTSRLYNDGYATAVVMIIWLYDYTAMLRLLSIQLCVLLLSLYSRFYGYVATICYYRVWLPDEYGLRHVHGNACLRLRMSTATHFYGYAWVYYNYQLWLWLYGNLLLCIATCWYLLPWSYVCQRLSMTTHVYGYAFLRLRMGILQLSTMAMAIWELDAMYRYLLVPIAVKLCMPTCCYYLLLVACCLLPVAYALHVSLLALLSKMFIG